ncbi:Pentatricopeptide repeat-containing protein [Glycine soja]
MQGTLVLPNEFTFATLINVCSILANLETGRRTHALVEASGFGSNLVAYSSLVDMYGKCNHVDEARLIFDSMCTRNVVSWTSMITTYSQNAQGHHDLQLFKEFIHSRLDKPNHFMLCSAISACASLGSLGSGKITLDMLGRVGRIEEAYQLAKSFQVEGDEYAMLWGTLLSASRLYGRVDIALEASNRLIESNQQVAGAYVTLSNAYALAGDWENAHNLRSEMKHTGVCKEPGSSWI